MKSHLESVESLLTQTLKAAESGLTESAEYSGIWNRIIHRCNIEINYLRQFTGNTGPSSTAKEALKPLTHMFGEQLTPNVKTISKEDLVPTPTEREQFLAQLREFTEQYPEMDLAKAEMRIKSPGGEVLFRALAKTLNIDNYQSATLDLPFLEAVKAKLIEHNEQSAKIEETTKAVNKKK